MRSGVTRHLRTAVPALLLTGLFLADLIVVFSDDDGIRAPWSGLMIAALAVLLLALGAVGRYWGIGLAVLATAVALLTFGSGGAAPPEDCTRECGLPLLALWALLVPTAVLIATVGALAGQLWRGRCLRAARRRRL